MANVFDIKALDVALRKGKDKALARAGQFGLNDALGGRVLPPLPPYPQGFKNGGNYNEAETVWDGKAHK